MSKHRIISIDFGNTIVHRKNGVFVAKPHALNTIRRLVNHTWTAGVYIISKVNEKQQEEVMTWLCDHDFYNKVGIDAVNVYFCKERKEKGEICSSLGITHHIDDRPEVMAHLSLAVSKYMFNPVPEDVVKYYNQIDNACIVTSWLDVERRLL